MKINGRNFKEHRANFVLRAFQAVPSRLRRVVFSGLSGLSYHFLPRRRLIALSNLQRAFPEKSKAERVAIAKRVFRNLGIVASEFFDIPYLTSENIGDLIRAEGVEHCLKALEKGKGVIMFGAHFGNWELEAIAVSLLVKPIVVIYRPLDDDVLDALVMRIRSSTGNKPLPKTKAMRAMLRSLKNNEILGILIDQNVDYYEGPFVDFFGRPSCTSDGVALLALHTGAPVLPAYMARQPDNRYRLVIGEEIDLLRTEDREEDIRENTQRFTKIIEKSIRQYPDQWLWVHQRWKTTLSRIPNKMSEKKKTEKA